MPKINQEEYEILKNLDDKWKWIARDRDRLLFAFNVKPRKGINYAVWDIAGWDDDDYLEIEDSDLFQFIQWEDEEPYNIAELIEEYEKDYKGSWEHAIEFSGEVFGESEETEVNKQKLIKKWESAIEAAEFYGRGKEDRLIEYMRNFVDDLNQLDEPEVLSSDWISKNVEYAYFDMLDGSGRLSSATAIIKPEKLKKLLVPKQIKPKELYKAITGISPSIEEVCDSSGTETFLDESVSVERIVEAVMKTVGPSEPEKPVIPQFVADFIKDKEEWMLFELFDENYLYDDHPEVAKWLYDDNSETNRKRELLLVRAKTKGYEIKQEQKYYALIKGHKNIYSGICFWIYDTEIEELLIDDAEIYPDVTAGYMIKATKDEWANLGINDDNADFVKVEEMEE